MFCCVLFCACGVFVQDGLEKVVAVVVEDAVESTPVQDSDHNEKSTIAAIKTSSILNPAGGSESFPTVHLRDSADLFSLLRV